MSSRIASWAGILVDPSDPDRAVQPARVPMRDNPVDVLLALERDRDLGRPGLALLTLEDHPGRHVHLPEGLHPSTWDFEVVGNLLLPVEDRLAELQGWLADHVVRVGACARLQLTPEAMRAGVVQAPQNRDELMRWGEHVQMLLNPAFAAAGAGTYPFQALWQGLGEFAGAMSSWRLFGVLPADNLLVAAEWWERVDHGLSRPVRYEFLNELRVRLKAMQQRHPAGRA